MTHVWIKNKGEEHYVPTNTLILSIVPRRLDRGRADADAGKKYLANGYEIQKHEWQILFEKLETRAASLMG